MELTAYEVLTYTLAVSVGLLVPFTVFILVLRTILNIVALVQKAIEAAVHRWKLQWPFAYLSIDLGADGAGRITAKTKRGAVYTCKSKYTKKGDGKYFNLIEFKDIHNKKI